MDRRRRRGGWEGGGGGGSGGGGGGAWGVAYAGGAYHHAGGVGGGGFGGGGYGGAPVYASPSPAYGFPSPMYATPSFESGCGMLGGVGTGGLSSIVTPTSLLPPSGGLAADAGWPCQPSSLPGNYTFAAGPPRLQPSVLVPGAGLSPGLPSPTAAAAPVGGSPSPATRPSRREGYTRFSRAEEAALSAGVLEYGAGSWKKILGAYPDFHPKRTPVCLKDKWRNLTKARLRRVHSVSSGLSVASSGGGGGGGGGGSAGPPSATS